MEGLRFQSTKMVVGLHGPTRWANSANDYQSGTGRMAMTNTDALEADFLERMSVEMADHVWAPSNHVVRCAVEQGWKLPPSSSPLAASPQIYLMPLLAGSIVLDVAAVEQKEGEPIREFI